MEGGGACSTHGMRSPQGRGVHTIRHGPGNAARIERVETAVVGITGLTTSDP
jgi:hypothetical protein